MTLCVLVPGFASSELYENSSRTNILWVSYTRLVAGFMGEMRLDADGVSPGPPDGIPLFAGAALGEYWDGPTKVLREQLRPHGYLLGQFGWDWRKSLLSAGAQLAGLIAAQVEASDPCAIVAHSAGGLVARAAWAELVARGKNNLVRRVITLGSPHQGTYAPVSLWSGSDLSLDQLLALNNQLGGPLLTAPIPGAYRYWTRADLVELSQTWPALYQILPMLGGSAATEDPLRRFCFVASAWPDSSRPAAAWLDYSREVFGPWLRSPASFPPRWVFTTVSGTGYPTPDGLVDVEQLGSPAAIGATNDGDGVVTGVSSIVNDSRVYVVTARHVDLPMVTISSGDLASWILEERLPPEPVPPPVEIDSFSPATLTGPPIPGPLGFFPSTDPCRSGRCRC